MKLLILTAFAFAAVISINGEPEVYYPEDPSSMTSDARKWYLQGIRNSENNIPVFSDILDLTQTGKSNEANSILKKELNNLLSQVNDANENTKTTTPRINFLVESLASWSENPGIMNRLKIKAALALVKNKRDNKSYYLLNGAARWCEIRREAINEIQEPTAASQALAAVLDGFKADAFLARDSFDDSAQIFVKGLAELVALQPFLPESAEDFHDVATELSAAMKAHAPIILNSNQDAVDHIKAYQATM